MAEGRSGLIGGLVIGIALLIITVIVVFTFVGTLDDANLLRATATVSTGSDNTVWLNGSGMTLTGFDVAANRDYAIATIINGSSSVAITDYTFNSASGLFLNTTATVYDDVNVTFTFIPYTNYENSVTDASRNLTLGVRNVSTKIPTILLIGAIVLLMGILVILFRQKEAMGLGTGNAGSL